MAALQEWTGGLADRQHVCQLFARPFRPASGNVAALAGGGGEARIMTILARCIVCVDFIIGDLNTGPIRYAG